MRAGYAYTTVASEPGGRTRVTTSFFLDERVYLDLYPEGETRPFLSVELGDTQLNIGPRTDGPITEAELSIFRDLAAKAAALLAEVERIHAEHTEQAERPDVA